MPIRQFQSVSPIFTAVFYLRYEGVRIKKEKSNPKLVQRFNRPFILGALIFDFFSALRTSDFEDGANLNLMLHHTSTAQKHHDAPKTINKNESLAKLLKFTYLEVIFAIALHFQQRLIRHLNAFA